MSELYKIKDAVESIDKLSFQDLDMLNEYLHNESWASNYVNDVEDKNNSLYYIPLASFLNSDQFGKESIKHYLMYKSRFLLSKTK